MEVNVRVDKLSEGGGGITWPGTMAGRGSGKGKRGGSQGRNGTNEVVWEGGPQWKDGQRQERSRATWKGRGGQLCDLIIPKGIKSGQDLEMTRGLEVLAAP